MCAYQAEVRDERGQKRGSGIRSQLALVPIQRGEDEEPAHSGGAAQPTDVAAPSLLTLPDKPWRKPQPFTPSVIPPDLWVVAQKHMTFMLHRVCARVATQPLLSLTAPRFTSGQLVRFLNRDPNKQVRTLTSLLPPHILREEISVVVTMV